MMATKELFQQSAFASAKETSPAPQLIVTNLLSKPIMLTKRLSRVVLLSILALILHGIEEIWAGFYETYPMFSAIGRLFSSRAEAVFVVYQVMFWIALLTFYALLVSETWRFRLTIAFGALLLYENQHLYYAMQTRRYYPGAITALAILFLDVAFWHEVWRSRRGIPFSSRRGRT